MHQLSTWDCEFPKYLPGKAKLNADIHRHNTNVVLEGESAYLVRDFNKHIGPDVIDVV